MCRYYVTDIDYALGIFIVVEVNASKSQHSNALNESLNKNLMATHTNTHTHTFTDATVQCAEKPAAITIAIRRVILTQR